MAPPAGSAVAVIVETMLGLLYTQMSKSAIDGTVITFSPTGHATSTFVVGKTKLLAAIVRLRRNLYP